MEMKNYQAEKVKFFKKQYSDEGWRRQLDFSVEGTQKKHGKNSLSKEIQYSLPDGTTSLYKNIQDIPLALGTMIGLQTKSKKVQTTNHKKSKFLPLSTTNVLQTYEQTSKVTIMESDIMGGTGEGPALEITMTSQIVCEQSSDQMQTENPGGFFAIERRSRF